MTSSLASLHTEEELLLITGSNGTSSTEFYPSTSGCSLPPLPSPRPGHITFLTAGSDSTVAVCGGGGVVIRRSQGWGDDPTTHEISLYWQQNLTTSCLVLDMNNKEWDETRMGNMAHQKDFVVTLPEVGVFAFAFGGRSSEFLPAGSMEWQKGPTLSVYPSCGVAISATSFLIINGVSGVIHEFDATISGPTSSEGWVAEKWPNLKTERGSDFSCSKVGQKVIISGGFHDDCDYGNYHDDTMDECQYPLPTTEILDLITYKLTSGGKLHRPRHTFYLATVRHLDQLKLFAIGGIGGNNGGPWSSKTPCVDNYIYENSKLNSVELGINCGVEEWVDDESRWEWRSYLGSQISYFRSVERSSRLFGIVAVPKNLICPS